MNFLQKQAFELAEQLGFGPVTDTWFGIEEETYQHGLRIGDVTIFVNAFPKEAGIAYFNHTRKKGFGNKVQYDNFEQKLKNVISYYQEKYSDSNPQIKLSTKD